MQVIGAFVDKKEAERPVFKQAIIDSVTKWVKPLGINANQRIRVTDLGIGDTKDNFYAIIDVTYKYPDASKWEELYKKLGFKGIEKELYKNYKKLKSGNLVIDTIEVNPSPLIGFGITISGNVVK